MDNLSSPNDNKKKVKAPIVSKETLELDDEVQQPSQEEIDAHDKELIHDMDMLLNGLKVLIQKSYDLKPHNKKYSIMVYVDDIKRELKSIKENV